MQDIAGFLLIGGHRHVILDVYRSALTLIQRFGSAANLNIHWARLLKRVFDLDLERCTQCGGTLKIIAAIEVPPVIARIFAQLHLPTRAPARWFDLFQAA